MSNPLRIAFVVEGPTDFFMLEPIVKKLLEGRDFVPQVLQPEFSEVFNPVGGWTGVCRWCLQSKEQGGGELKNNPLFLFYDLLILQLDADVARNNYSAGHLEDPFSDSTLPCEQPCPPSSDTTDQLRAVVIRWMGESIPPPRVVLCTPSKALETWILVALFPDDNIANSSDIECRQNPSHFFRCKPRNRQLISNRHKNTAKYQEFAAEFALNWNTVKERCSEAIRFENDFMAELAQLKM